MKGRILITGGSGTIGKAILRRANKERWPARFSIYSRSEFLQAELRSLYPDVNCILGDIRDYDRLQSSIAGHDIVIHAAAMKRIPESEAQPTELHKTNVMGSLNVIRACRVNNVKRAVFLSTDKAAAPITAYGASKLMMERAIQNTPPTPTTFTAVRYGNVIASRGSVIPVWKEQERRAERLTITDPNMSRFWISPEKAVNYIMEALTIEHGKIWVPKMKALTLATMAGYLCPNSKHTYTGLRSQERIHEYLVHPEEQAKELRDGYILSHQGTTGHTYRSDTAPTWDKNAFLYMLSGGE